MTKIGGANYAGFRSDSHILRYNYTTGILLNTTLMFLIYINDIGDKYHLLFSFLLMICVLYRTVASLEDTKQLHCDLDYQNKLNLYK